MVMSLERRLSALFLRGCLCRRGVLASFLRHVPTTVQSLRLGLRGAVRDMPLVPTRDFISRRAEKHRTLQHNDLAAIGLAAKLSRELAISFPDSDQSRGISSQMGGKVTSEQGDKMAEPGFWAREAVVSGIPFKAATFTAATLNLSPGDETMNFRPVSSVILERKKSPISVAAAESTESPTRTEEPGGGTLFPVLHVPCFGQVRLWRQGWSLERVKMKSWQIMKKFSTLSQGLSSAASVCGSTKQGGRSRCNRKKVTQHHLPHPIVSKQQRSFPSMAGIQRVGRCEWALDKTWVSCFGKRTASLLKSGAICTAQFEGVLGRSDGGTVVVTEAQRR